MSPALLQPPQCRAAAPAAEGSVQSPVSAGPAGIAEGAPGAGAAEPGQRSVRSLISRRIHEEQDKLLRITGAPGDVERDPRAYGQASLTFKDVSFSVRLKGNEERQILAPASGHFEPGALVALMGPSGCGKTTLLDILAGKKSRPHGGQVLFNGRARDRLFRRLTAYVPQEDVMFPYCTVKEVVLFTERLKQERPSGLTRRAACRSAEGLLQTLGLSEVADSWIGNEHIRGISGGQRRRVSLARGLAAGAQMLFCDEPTSGLSSTDAETCVRYMRLAAGQLGVTIVVVIHQPRREVARLFDHLLLMTTSPGRLVYNGPMVDAVEHWEMVGHPVPRFANPTDHYLDLVTPDAPGAQEEKFVAYYLEHCAPKVAAAVEEAAGRERRTSLELLELKRENMLQYGDLPAVSGRLYGAGYRRQFQAILGRKLRLSLRDKQGVIMALVGAAVKAFVVGIAYLDIGDKDAQSQMGFIFMVLMSCSMDGMVTMPQLIEERAIVKVEAAEALYSEWIHISVFSIMNMVIGIIANSIFVVVLFALSGIHWSMFGAMYGWTTILFLTMDSLYGMIAAIARDSTIAQLLALPFLMLFLLYNGFTVTKKTAPSFLHWAIDLSPVACSIESIAILAEQEFEGEHGWSGVVDFFGYQPRTLRNCSVMITICVLFRLIQVVCFKAFNDVKR